jgi:hypothetical protein
MEQNEEYLGGFSSPYLKKGVLTGFGIYVTSLRVFGVKNRKAGVAWLLGAAAGGAHAARTLSEKMSKEDNSRTISELFESKDFEIRKDQIATIEVTKPRFAFGHLNITSKTGESTSVKIGEKHVYEQVRALMEAFYPEAVKQAK